MLAVAAWVVFLEARLCLATPFFVNQRRVVCRNKPDYHLAMGGERSQPMFEELLVQLRETYNSDRVKCESLQAHYRY